MSDLFSGLTMQRAYGKRERMNPRPPVPNTGWKTPRSFPSLGNYDHICLDLETYDPGLDPAVDTGPGWGVKGRGFICGLAVGAGKQRWYFPMRHKEEAQDNMNPQEVLHWAAESFRNPQQEKEGFHLLYDVGWLATEGVQVNGNLFCVQTAEAQIIKTTAQFPPKNNLNAVAKRYLEGIGKTSDDLCEWLWKYYGTGGNPSEEQLNRMRKYIYRTPPRLCGPYAIGDVDLPMRIRDVMTPIIEDLGLETVVNLENALIPVVVAMRMKGVPVDIPAAERADEELSKTIITIGSEINYIAGRKINPGSPKDLGKAFEAEGIRLPLTPKGSYCVKADVLKLIDHPLAAKVIEIQELKKVRDTFVRGAILGSHVHGVVRGEFLPLTTITGRWSSRNPNLQNIPSRKELAKVVRAIFRACMLTPSSHWRKYDYASIEARLLAHFACGPGADELRWEYNNSPWALGLTDDKTQDADYHLFTMKMIKDVMGVEMSRKAAKNINFACIYGAQDKKLAQMLGLDQVEGQRFMEAYHGALRYIKTTMGRVSASVQEHGETRTILGRRVRFDEWVPKRFEKGAPRPMPMDLDTAYGLYGTEIKRCDTYAGLNYLIQGSAADLMKVAMVMCYEQGIFDVTGVPVLTVHDELDFDVPEQTPAVHEAFREMVNVMQTAIPFSVPIRVDGEWGPNWSELYDLAA